MTPRILVFDIESIGVNALKSDLGYVACIGYKWVGEQRSYCMTLEEYDGFKKFGFSDKKLLRAFSKVAAKADLLVGHFAKYFDRKFINGRLFLNHLAPIPATKLYDTCASSWRLFNFSNNRLKHLAKIRQQRHQKLENEWPDWWFRVMAGDVKVLRRMASYCKGDIFATEEYFEGIAPFDDQLIKLYSGKRCGFCGGKVHNRGTVIARTKRYRRYVCVVCGKWGRDDKALREAA